MTARTPEYERIAEASKGVEYGLHDVARRLYQVIKHGDWRDYTTPMGKRIQHDRFIDFLTEPWDRGLGTTPETVLAAAKDLDYAHESIRRLLAEDVPAAREVGRPSSDANGSDTTINGDRGSTYVIARLKRDRPDLAQAVIEGQLSANAAAVEAGFRPPRVSLRLDDMSKAAATLRQKLDAEQLEELRNALV